MTAVAFSGEYHEAYHLFSHSRQALYDQISITVSLCLGNIFIFMLLSQRGSIVLALVTTTRKVFTVLLTAHNTALKLEGMRGIGIGVVIAGIVMETGHSLLGKNTKKSTYNEKQKIK